MLTALLLSTIPLAQDKSLEDWVPPFVIRLRLSTQFQVLKGELVVARDFNEPGGLPTDAFERLYYIDGRRRTKILDHRPLVGKVRIDTPAAALDYVRLWTSPRTYWMFGSPLRGEVLRAEDVDLNFVFGDRELASKLKSTSVGNRGVLPRGSAPPPFPAARVVRSARGFVVHRTLVAVEYESRPLAEEVEETVSRDGRVVRRVRRSQELSQPHDWSRFFQVK
jgi:hypothetical protein